MKYCIKCNCLADKTIVPDNALGPVDICSNCLDEEMTFALREMEREGLVSQEYDTTFNEPVYRLKRDV